MTESKFLKEARIKSGLTQRQLSKQLGFSNPQFISNWERGLSFLPPAKMKLFSKLTNVDIDHLMQVKIIAYKKWLRSHL